MLHLVKRGKVMCYTARSTQTINKKYERNFSILFRTLIAAGTLSFLKPIGPAPWRVISTTRWEQPELTDQRGLVSTNTLSSQNQYQERKGWVACKPLVSLSFISLTESMFP